MKIMERLHKANDLLEVNDYEGALIEFNKIVFFDKNSNFLFTSVAEVYAERAEIYIKLCDFSSAIANFKKAV